MKNWIKKRLHNYKVNLNEVDTTLPLQLTTKKKVAVIGGGLAGISSASLLAERGFEVSLFERDSFLGGKVGSWEFESKGETLRTEHGFHAFFKQYYNLNTYMQQIGAFKNLKPIDDYVILYENNQKQGFKDIETTPGLNILDLKKHGIYGWPTLLNPFSAPLLHLLKFDFDKTFKQFDKENFAQFARRTFLPKKMQLVFNSFARAFFAEPENMSMAELMKGFHFYFLSNDEGLVYDVLENDFQHSLIDYCISFLEKHQAKIKLNTPVTELAYNKQQFIVNGETFDYCVVSTDVNGTKKLIENAKGLENYTKLQQQTQALKNSGNYAVLRVWTDKFEQDKDMPFFVITDRLKCCDSITLYHKTEIESKAWSEKNKGGIFEMHSYAVPANMDKATCYQALLDELYHYFPELKGMEIKHEYYQFRDDFSAYHTGLHQNRPEVKTEVEGLYFAGDWVKMDNCAMLMEGAYVSGALAANYILSQEKLQEKQLVQVPPKGLLA